MIMITTIWLVVFNWKMDQFAFLHRGKALTGGRPRVLISVGSDLHHFQVPASPLPCREVNSVDEVAIVVLGHRAATLPGPSHLEQGGTCQGELLNLPPSQTPLPHPPRPYLCIWTRDIVRILDGIQLMYIQLRWQRQTDLSSTTWSLSNASLQVSSTSFTKLARGASLLFVITSQVLGMLTVSNIN